MTYNIEEALRSALNGVPMPKSKNSTIRKNFAPPSFHRHQTTFKYSVQESYGGPRFILEVTDDTFIREDVKRKAENLITEKGYTNVVLLDVIQS